MVHLELKLLVPHVQSGLDSTRKPFWVQSMRPTTIRTSSSANCHLLLVVLETWSQSAPTVLVQLISVVFLIALDSLYRKRTLRPAGLQLQQPSLLVSALSLLLDALLHFSLILFVLPLRNLKFGIAFKF